MESLAQILCQGRRDERDEGGACLSSLARYAANVLLNKVELIFQLFLPFAELQRLARYCNGYACILGLHLKKGLSAKRLQVQAMLI